MKGYLLTTRVEGDALASMPRDEAQWYFNFWAGDLKARWTLSYACERIYDEGNHVGAGILWNAMQYLSDRDGYQVLSESRGGRTR